MTTAVWSYKHMTLGADRQCATWIDVGKVFPLRDGSYLAGAGYYDDILEVAKWLNEGGDEDEKPNIPGKDDDKDSDYILVEPDGTAYWLTSPYLRKVKITNEFYAVGSGSRAALGALYAGATVEEALSIAAKLDNYTGPVFNTVKIEKAPTKK